MNTEMLLTASKCQNVNMSQEQPNYYLYYSFDFKSPNSREHNSEFYMRAMDGFVNSRNM